LRRKLDAVFLTRSENGTFFAHPTAYILISKENIHVEDGNWWPELNGHRILYGQQNKIGILSPIKISNGLFF
jgi:hypothetical protein